MRDHETRAVSYRLLRLTLVGLALSLITMLGLTMAQATAAQRGHKAKHHARHKNHKARHGKHRTGSKSGSTPSSGSGHSALKAHGALLHLAPGLHANMNKSNNWMGFNQGTLEQGGKLFNSITGQWTVPTATQHTAGQSEASSDWIGIGGGCTDAACTATDSTLIQTGTEQDVDSSGHASYSAWWEVIPAPSMAITNMTVNPGDKMSASIAEAVPNSNVWTISLTDQTNGQTFSTTVPYSSTHATAEWIEETPLEIGTNAGFSALPNLTNPNFDPGTVNGAPAGLKSSEAMQLVDSNQNVIGTPSAPDSDADGFGACTWAGTCTAPSS